VWGLGFGVWGLELIGVLGFGGLEFRVWGLGFGVNWGLGLGAWSFGFDV
jgi:hypothetical protein